MTTRRRNIAILTFVWNVIYAIFLSIALASDKKSAIEGNPWFVINWKANGQGVPTDYETYVGLVGFYRNAIPTSQSESTVTWTPTDTCESGLTISMYEDNVCQQCEDAMSTVQGLFGTTYIMIFLLVIATFLRINTEKDSSYYITIQIISGLLSIIFVIIGISTWSHQCLEPLTENITTNNADSIVSGVGLILPSIGLTFQSIFFITTMCTMGCESNSVDHDLQEPMQVYVVSDAMASTTAQATTSDRVVVIPASAVFGPSHEQETSPATNTSEP